MKSVKFFALTAVAVAPLAVVSMPAIVQAAEAEEVTEVVVTGRRPLAESEAAALKVQRNSDSLVSVLSADEAGNLPDQNIAFAVGRLPGVAVERDQGQARYVNLRGAPVYWTTLSFDGLSVVSPEGRASRFDNIPSAIASQITVQKAIVPSMSGDTVAGNVDIRTRRAFDYKGQKITGKLGFGRVELGKGDELDSSLVYSNIFMGGKLGIVAQASYYKREMATENWETDPYLTNTTNVSKRFANETKNKHYRLTRENYSASTRVDYKIDANNSIFASTINTVFHDDELRDQFIFQLANGTDAAGNSYTSAPFINANDPKYGTVYGARISARITYRDNDDRMSTNTIGGEHKFSGDLDMSWRLNYTWTDNTGDNPIEMRFATNNTGNAFAQRPTVVYDFRDGSSNIATLYRTTGTSSARVQGAQVQNVEDFDMAMSQATGFKGSEITKAYTGKVDFDKKTELFGRDTKVEFGFLYTTRTKEYNETDVTATIDASKRWKDVAQDGPYLGKQRLGYTFRYTNKDAAYKLFNGLTDATKEVYDQAAYYSVTEDIAAAYLMATTTFDWGNLVYGVRAEQINNSGEAYVSFPAVGTTPAGARLVEVSSDELLFYPSAHLNWNVTETLKARFGLTTSASRADYDDLRPNFTIDDGNDTITGGNPNAEPEKQIGLDAYLEWYRPNTFISAGLFYKDISNVLLKTSGTYGKTDLNDSLNDRSGYKYTTITNGGDGYIQGFEFFYSGNVEPLVEQAGLPAWMGGFGAKFSATFTDSEVTVPAFNRGTLASPEIVPARKIGLLGTSDEVYNLQATYEKYGLTVRLAYQYRTPWAQSVGDYRVIGGNLVPDGNGDIYWDSDEEVDLSVRYQVNKHIEVFFDGSNLTNDGAKRYADTVAYPIEYEKFGRRFVGGFRFNF